MHNVCKMSFFNHVRTYVFPSRPTHVNSGRVLFRERGREEPSPHFTTEIYFYQYVSASFPSCNTRSPRSIDSNQFSLYIGLFPLLVPSLFRTRNHHDHQLMFRALRQHQLSDQWFLSLSLLPSFLSFSLLRYSAAFNASFIWQTEYAINCWRIDFRTQRLTV